MKDYLHSIVLWVHQATSTDGGSSFNRGLLKNMLGESWKSRIVGVLTKVDVEDSESIAKIMMKGDEDDIDWYAVINRKDKQLDGQSFADVEDYETSRLEELLGTEVSSEFLGVSKLRQRLIDSLVQKTKELLQGNKFNKQIRGMLNECAEELDNEPDNVHFNQRYYEILGNLRLALQTALLSNTDISRNIENRYTQFAKELEDIHPLGGKSLKHYYAQFMKDQQYSGGLEQSSSLSQEVLRQFLVSVREDVGLKTGFFLSGYFGLVLENIASFIENSKVLENEDEKFVKLFSSKMLTQGNKDYSYILFQSLRAQWKEMFKSCERFLFPSVGNSISDSYMRTLIEPLKQGLNNGSPIKGQENSEAYLIGQELAKKGSKSTGDNFVSAMSIALHQLGSLIHYLISPLRCIVRGAVLKLVDDLNKVYEPHLKDLAEQYDKKKEEIYNSFQKRKPILEKRKSDLETLMCKYPELFFQLDISDDEDVLVNL